MLKSRCRVLWLLFVTSAAGAIILIYVVRPWHMWREDWRVERVRRVGERIVEMILLGPATTKLQFRAGQFIWITFAPNRPPLHDHPFSIASGPADLPRLRIIIGEVGDCTRGFERVAPGTRVAVDGPHGSFVVPHGKTPVVMIAGGVGIAPLLGMLEGAAESGDKRPYRLLYATRTLDALAYLDQLRELQSRLDLSITCLVDQKSRPSWCAAGPLCPDHVHELLRGVEPRDATALICGPARMMELAADGLLDAGLVRASILYERFDFGAGRGRIDRLRSSEAFGVFAVLMAAMAIFSLR